VVSNAARNGVILHGNQPLLHTETDRSDPPPLSRCLPLVLPPAMDVGEGQKRTRCIDSLVRRRGGVECSEKRVILHGNFEGLPEEEDDFDSEEGDSEEGS
jgi:hypothetical protein